MRIKRIVLNNFRQFSENQSIDFSYDPSSNITIIMGENGSGKTTLAQAFLWVLYNETEFKDKRVVNKKSIDNLITNGRVNVRVDLYIDEGDSEYIITRSQEYIKRSSRIDSEQAVLQIIYVKNGQTEMISSIAAQRFINNILPKELSRFFFFDGERIKNMSDEIQKGKSKEFANAVRSLVGLNAVMNAIDHIRDSRGSNTVIGRYNKKIDATGNKEVHDINNKLDEYDFELQKLDDEYQKIKPNIEYYQRKSLELEQQIISYAPVESLKLQYDKLTKEIKGLENERKSSIKSYLKLFNTNGLAFFLEPLIKITLNELKATDKIDKGIPHIHADTINYLIHRKFCICGNPIESNSKEIKQLEELLEYIPPKSIGTLLSQNVKTSEMYLKQGSTFFESMECHLKNIRTIEDKLNNKREEQGSIYEQIVDIGKLQDLKAEKSNCDKMLQQSSDRMSDIDRSIGSIKTEVSRLKSKKEKYINVDKNNKKYILYREYARRVYLYLIQDYSKSESYIRDKLEKKINEIFYDIFEGGLSLSLDENYNIKVKVNELQDQDDDIERSTAQNYSVIFAFIAGIIDIAKEKSKNDDKGIFDNATNYPLVMDAPLSAFDKKRINNICNTIPKIAQQVIFFIKDTDGDVAEKHLGNSVGKKYEIIKENELNSIIKERG